MSSGESDNEELNNNNNNNNRAVSDSSSVSLKRQFSCYSLKTMIDGGDGLDKQIKTKISDWTTCHVRDKFDAKKQAPELIWENQQDMLKSEKSLEYLCNDILEESFTNTVTPVSSHNLFGNEGDTLNDNRDESENETNSLRANAVQSDNMTPSTNSTSNPTFVEGPKVRKKPSIGRCLGGCCFKKNKSKSKKKDSDSSEDEG